MRRKAPSRCKAETLSCEIASQTLWAWGWDWRKADMLIPLGVSCWGGCICLLINAPGHCFLLASSLPLTEWILSPPRSEVPLELCSHSFCVICIWPNSFLKCFAFLFVWVFCFVLSEAIEKSVVPWVNDQDVPFCPDCGSKFSIRHRRHHCRLCGSIMCKKCSELISLPLASRSCGCQPGPWSPPETSCLLVILWTFLFQWMTCGISFIHLLIP